MLLLLACCCWTTLAAPSLRIPSHGDIRYPTPAPIRYPSTLLRIQRSPMSHINPHGRIIIWEPTEPEQSYPAPTVP